MASRSISKSVIWQLSGKFALQGILFFTTPIFTRLLTPADYGYTALYASWLSIISLIVGLQVHGSIGYARIEYGEDNLPKYLSSVMTVSFLSFLSFLFIAIIFRGQLAPLMGFSPIFVILVVIQSFFYFVFNFEIARLDQLKKVEKSTVLSLTQSILIIIFSLLFVILKEENKAQAKIFGQAIPTIVFGLCIFINVYLRGKTLWNTEYIKSCLILTLPLILHGIGGLVFNQSDRIMLQRMQGESVLGIYSVAIGLCSVLTIISGATNVAWAPFYLDFKKQNNTNEILLHSKRYIRFYTLVSIGFILLSYDVYKIMAPSEYYDGMKLIPILVLSNYFNYLYLFPVNYEFYKKKTKNIPIATLSAAFINIFINWLLIPKYSIVGAALGTLIAHIILFILHEIMACYIDVKDYEYRDIKLFLIPIIIMSTICLTFFFLPDMIIWIRWSLASIIAIYFLLDLKKTRSIF